MRLAAHAPHDLADQEPERVDVIAVRRRRAPTTAAPRASAVTISSQSYIASSGSVRRIAGSPARCASTMRTVTSCFPLAGELRPVARHAAHPDRPARARRASARRPPPSPCRPRRRSTSVSRRHGRVRSMSAHPRPDVDHRPALELDRHRGAEPRRARGSCSPAPRAPRRSARRVAEDLRDIGHGPISLV